MLCSIRSKREKKMFCSLHHYNHYNIYGGYKLC